jgi:NAD(P)-dependent dehydrogenase (short-subunit alcohol dehydrogenase family)
MKGTIFDLEGCVALVTGSSKGLGYDLAMDLAKAGADIVIVSRHLDEAKKAAEDIRKIGVKSLAVKADVSEPKACKTMIDSTIETFGKIDILVNNAGVVHRGPMLDVEEDIYDHVFDIDLKGLFFCSKFAAKEMMKKNKGTIINITSVAADIAAPMFGIYSAAKAGAQQLTKACALEWAHHGIRVNAIAPYSTPTTQNKEFLAIKSNHDVIANKTALKRLGQAKDLTGVLLLLASGASEFITGQNFYVDGGASAGWPAEIIPD